MIETTKTNPFEGLVKVFDKDEIKLPSVGIDILGEPLEYQEGPNFSEILDEVEELLGEPPTHYIEDASLHYMIFWVEKSEELDD